MAKKKGSKGLVKAESSRTIIFQVIMNYPAAELRGINYSHSRSLLIGNPVPYKKTLDSRSKNCGNDRQRNR